MTEIQLAITVNWEGRHLKGVEALARLHAALPAVPLTHYVSAAYLARGGDPMSVIEAMLPAFSRHDEVGLLGTAWMSIHGAPLATAPVLVTTQADPLLHIEHPGVAPQVDAGYTRALSSLPASTVRALIRNARCLLRPLLTVLIRRGLDVGRMLQGFRACHCLASDGVLEECLAAGFLHDSSAIDAQWMRRAPDSIRESAFHPSFRLQAQLWGNESHTEQYLSNQGSLRATAGFGVDSRTQPFYVIDCDAQRLLEMPLNCGVIPPRTVDDLGRLVTATLSQPSNGVTTLCVALQQETASVAVDVLVKLLGELIANRQLRFGTVTDIATRLMLTDPVAPRQGRTMSRRLVNMPQVSAAISPLRPFSEYGLPVSQTGIPDV